MLHTSLFKLLVFQILTCCIYLSDLYDLATHSIYSSRYDQSCVTSTSLAASSLQHLQHNEILSLFGGCIYLSGRHALATRVVSGCIILHCVLHLPLWTPCPCNISQ